MNRPGLAVLVPDLRAPLRHAIDMLAKATTENVQLRADIVERDEKIATLQAMVQRAYSGDTERPEAP